MKKFIQKIKKIAGNEPLVKLGVFLGVIGTAATTLQGEVTSMSVGQTGTHIGIILATLASVIASVRPLVTPSKNVVTTTQDLPSE